MFSTTMILETIIASLQPRTFNEETDHPMHESVEMLRK